MRALRDRYPWHGGLDPSPLPCDDELRMVEGTDAPLRNISTGNRDSKYLSFPWVVTLLSSVLITTIIVDVLGNLLVIVSVFRNRKLRKAGGRVNFDLMYDVLMNAEDRAKQNTSELKLQAVMKGPSHLGSPPPVGLRKTVNSRRIACNAFVVSLAIADLLVAIYPYPLVLTAIFHDRWIAGDIHCQISGFLMGLSVIGSIFNITGIAINRYCYICHSLKYDKLFSNKNTVCYVVLVWALTILAIVPNWFVESLQYDPRVYSCTFAQSVSSLYTITVVVVHFILPIGIVTYCYLRIWILVIQVRKRVKPDSRPKIKPHDFRNFLTMFVVFVLFAVCWAPLNLIGLAVAIHPRLGQAIPEWLFTASYFMAYFNSCLNGVIYGVLNHNFRTEYKRIVLAIFKFNC
ncbi:Melatonin receptor type 1A-A [Anabarilius grahami]|uniref:Melatonin receptor type 1A-A n=1 Tax=Anabarilius grahami TaxID=495550 RepID=A0A3N0YMB9_ANAGA|nr:Melatonin receptor type 1A-A [Anabarilius grahami]